MCLNAEWSHSDGPDADLIEYVVLSVQDLSRIATVVATVRQLVGSGAISLIDAVLLTRDDDTASVTVRAAQDDAQLAGLLAMAEGHLRLSDHDVALVAATVDPAAAVLMLLVEDRWALGLAAAAREAGGHLSAGERVTSGRVRAGLAQRRVGPAPVAAADDVRPFPAPGDLLSRGPQTSHGDERWQVDAAAQVARVATLLEQGMLTFEQYEIQRRRAIRD